MAGVAGGAIGEPLAIQEPIGGFVPDVLRPAGATNYIGFNSNLAWPEKNGQSMTAEEVGAFGCYTTNNAQAPVASFWVVCGATPIDFADPITITDGVAAPDIDGDYRCEVLKGVTAGQYFWAIEIERNLGPELLSNGNFDDGGIGWATGAGWSITSYAEANSVNGTAITQIVTAEIGVSYRIRFQVSNIDRDVLSVFTANFGGVETDGMQNDGIFVGTIVAVDDTSPFTLVGNGESFGASGIIDNASIREIL